MDHLRSSALDDSMLVDVVPHLLRSFGRARGRDSGRREGFDARTVRDFTIAVLDTDETIAIRFVEGLRAEGATAEQLYLGLFSDSARLLGRYWETDRCPFTEVTLALWRLHRMVRDVSAEFRRESPRRVVALQALLTTAPGEQHSFGLVILSEWFNRAGWAIHPGPFDTVREIGAAVGGRRIAIVGFSAGSETNLDRLAASIAVVRRKSINRRIGIMVGGSLFNERPELTEQVGADASAIDAPEALAKAERYALCGQWATA